MAKKKQKVVAEDILLPQIPQVLTPDGSEAKKAINIQTSVTKDDMATLIHVNIKTELNNELNTIANSIKCLEAKKNTILEKANKEIHALLNKQGYTNVNIHTSHIHFNFDEFIVDIRYGDASKRCSNQQLTVDNKLKGYVSTKQYMENMTYTNQEIQDYIKEINQLYTSKTNIEKNLATANKEYVKANIVASLIGSSDKGEDFIKNISNIGINIIKSLKENTVPLIGISQ